MNYSCDLSPRSAVPLARGSLNGGGLLLLGGPRKSTLWSYIVDSYEGVPRRRIWMRFRCVGRGGAPGFPLKISNTKLTTQIFTWFGRGAYIHGVMMVSVYYLLGIFVYNVQSEYLYVQVCVFVSSARMYKCCVSWVLLTGFE